LSAASGGRFFTVELPRFADTIAFGVELNGLFLGEYGGPAFQPYKFFLASQAINNQPPALLVSGPSKK